MTDGHKNTQTADGSLSVGPQTPPARAVLVAAHGVGRVGTVYAVGPSGIVIGRGDDADLVVDDAKVSRQHARVRMRGGIWFVEDLGSRNGTHVDGGRIEGKWRGVPSVIRVGRGVLVPGADTGALATIAPAPTDRAIAGFSLRAAWRRIDEIGKAGFPLHLQGQSGSGKEIAARRFHDQGVHRDGPFVAVNCAAVPEELAERLLFGAVKGAYSGAVADAVGLVQSAGQGTLFLDEVAELPLPVQAKLLRVLDNQEVTALGATRAVRVSFGLVSATNVQLSDAVAQRRFRADLYYRIAGHTVALPALQQRLEEIALHVQAELDGVAPPVVAAADFIEACLLRRWNGNVRELRAQVRRAVTEARLRGANEIRAVDLQPTASASVAATDDPLADRGAVLAALDRCAGNVSACARELGVHRTQLRRWMERHADDLGGSKDGSSGLSSR